MLQAINLVKNYSATVRAVDGVSFSVAEGRCLGLLGPNGAGKTTTIEMLEGVVAPSSGQVLFQQQPIKDDFYRHIGIQFQRTALQDHITVGEALRMFAALYSAALPLEKVTQACSLGDFLRQDVKQISGGQRQRLLLAMALVHDPLLLFLDEPTTGLDPAARRQFWELVENIKGLGKTILLTTHYMEEAYRLCDDLVIMDKGRIIASGSPQQLLESHFDEVLLQLPRKNLPSDSKDWPLQGRLEGDVVAFACRDVDASLRQLIAADICLQGVSIRLPTLEDLFLNLTTEAAEKC